MALVLEGRKKIEEVVNTPICTPVINDTNIKWNHDSSTNIPTNQLSPQCSIPDSVVESKHNSFTLNMSASEDFKSLIESLPVGNSYPVRNFSVNIRRGEPIETRVTTVEGDVLTFNNFHLDFPTVDQEIELGDTVRPMWSPEFIVRSHGPIRRSGGLAHSGSRRQILGEAVLWSPEIEQSVIKQQEKLFPPLEKMMDINRILKDKNERWISFQQATGHWDTTIQNAIKGNKRAIAKMTQLSNSRICILGTAWKGNHWRESGDIDCHTCHFLGTTALRKFTASLINSNYNTHCYYPTKAEAYDEYKIMFEYHWNTVHANSH